MQVPDNFTIFLTQLCEEAKFLKVATKLAKQAKKQAVKLKERQALHTITLYPNRITE